MSDDGDDDVVEYDGWALQLAPLASQHHLSAYSRLKYGQRGSPTSYAPLSLHLPDVVRELRERQQKYAEQVRWWPCPSAATLVIPAARQRAALAAGEPIPHPDLQQELSSAISEPIPLRPPSQPSHPPDVKTSESHPINVSQIIPPESLVAMSTHLVPCKKSRPVLFEIHQGQRSSPGPEPKYLSSKHLRSSVSGALNATINTRISLSPLPVSSRILLSLKRTFKGQSGPSNTDQTQKPSLTPPLTTHTLPTTYALHPCSSHVRPPTAPSSPIKTPKLRAASTASSRQAATNRRPFKLGNLFLSSCPGKKVRLDGPVRGRSAVCRDLVVDLRRMKMLGARCVVCCLDDEELEFLIGASWSEYCDIAHRQGLDVLRLPVPEGLSPLSPKALDADLDRIIKQYTLQGTSVLVHCRGGVGRAGLFACCWMLRLGLCGWIETGLTPSTTSSSVSETKIVVPSESFRWDSGTVVRQDTLQMVERVIEVIRRRRSVKAIETLEQVQFLVEYVDYLRACGRADDSEQF